jgi:hypothetical protein
MNILTFIGLLHISSCVWMQRHFRKMAASTGEKQANQLLPCCIGSAGKERKPRILGTRMGKEISETVIRG